jgi:hypothetical protein
MKFFIPFAKDQTQQQSVYAAIREFLSKELGAIFSDSQIRVLDYTHEGTDYHAEVGKPHALNREPVIAILYEEQRNLYHVCTPNRGVVRGMSILVGAHSVSKVDWFEKDEGPSPNSDP